MIKLIIIGVLIAASIFINNQFVTKFRRAVIYERLLHSGILGWARVVDIKETQRVHVGLRQDDWTEPNKTVTIWREVVVIQTSNGGPLVRTIMAEKGDAKRVYPVGTTFKVLYDPKNKTLAVDPEAKNLYRYRQQSIFLAVFSIFVGFFLMELVNPGAHLTNLILGTFFLLLRMIELFRFPPVTEFFQEQMWTKDRSRVHDTRSVQPPKSLYEPQRFPAMTPDMQMALRAVGFGKAYSVIRPFVKGTWTQEEFAQGHPEAQSWMQDDEEESSSSARPTQPSTDPIGVAPTSLAECFAAFHPTTDLPWLVRQANGIRRKRIFAQEKKVRASYVNGAWPDWAVYHDQRTSEDEVEIAIQFGQLFVQFHWVHEIPTHSGCTVRMPKGTPAQTVKKFTDALCLAQQEEAPETIGRYSLVLTFTVLENA